MLTRRNLLHAAAMAAVTMLAGCSGARGGDVDDAVTPDQTAPAVDAPGAVLVAYFSATGNTEEIASAVAERLGADVFAIEAAEPYTDADLDYNDSSSRTSTERADARPELAQVTPDGWGDYQTVFLGYPIWWGEAAWPLRTFAEGNDFAGKIVVPFCTSASSGIGDSGAALAELAGGGDWRDGERFSAGATDDAAAWVDGLGLA
ncbi:MAG TPA: flavodoxin [Candidatus Olsenella excrementavium]|uniref:Flavodoxin n=1 Tax=Candidatus Olsenella excrementavium TaxID=2838709 RepID=A0A9D2CHG7_9ACTN|nr:flavodoxin [Candidatus Olsenella excrementavium]